jgi:hypothetical protein
LLLLFWNIALDAQQFMLVENVNNLKNFKYYTGDQIRLKIESEQRIIEGAITGMTDSSLIIDSWEIISFNDVGFIYRDRFMVQLSRGILLTAGVAYFSIDTFNRLINDDAPVILLETAVISGGLVGLNFLLIPLRYKRIKTDTWRILTIDFSDLTNYQPTIQEKVP